jgi:hypothetical protein
MSVFAALSVALVVAGSPPVEKKLTLELRQAPAPAVFAMLAQATAQDIVVDECVKNRTLDIVLKNAPARVVLDVVAAKLDVHYEGHEPMVVRCGLAADTSTDDARWSRRLSVEVRDSKASALFGVVAEAMGLRGGVVMQAKDTTLSLHLTNVRARTLVEAVVESADFGAVRIEGDHLLVLPR